MLYDAKTIQGFQVPVTGMARNEGGDVVVSPPQAAQTVPNPHIAMQSYFPPEVVAQMKADIVQLGRSSVDARVDEIIRAKAGNLEKDAPLWDGSTGRALQLGGVAVGGVLVFLGGKWVYRKVTGKPGM